MIKRCAEDSEDLQRSAVDLEPQLRMLGAVRDDDVTNADGRRPPAFVPVHDRTASCRNFFRHLSLQVSTPRIDLNSAPQITHGVSGFAALTLSRQLRIPLGDDLVDDGVDFILDRRLGALSERHQAQPAGIDKFVVEHRTPDRDSALGSINLLQAKEPAGFADASHWMLRLRRGLSQPLSEQT
jgi:hypothetical protein